MQSVLIMQSHVLCCSALLSCPANHAFDPCYCYLTLTVYFGSVVPTGYMQSVIHYQPGDIIMAATSLAEAAVFGTRKTEIKRIRMIKG